MAKIKKRKLCWTASESAQVVAYKLYWAQDGKVSYDSSSARLGNVTEVVLPDDVEDFFPKGGPIEFGISAVDELGNESDLITIHAPYQFNVPQAPGQIWIDGPQKSSDTEESKDGGAFSIVMAQSTKGEEKPREERFAGQFSEGSGSQSQSNASGALRIAENS